MSVMRVTLTFAGADLAALKPAAADAADLMIAGGWRFQSAHSHKMDGKPEVAIRMFKEAPDAP